MSGWSLTLMARVKLPANASYPRQKSCPPLFVDWMRPVPLATEGASVGRWCGRARSSVKLTVESRLGSFGNQGNGHYWEELRQGLAVIRRYLAAHQLSQERSLLRLDGQYGTGAVLSDLASFAFVTRGKDYAVLDHPLLQARLHLPPDQFQQRPERKTRAKPLRLSRGAGGTRGRAGSRGGGDPSSQQKEASRWRHTFRRRL
jgi:hypothetical protein